MAVVSSENKTAQHVSLEVVVAPSEGEPGEAALPSPAPTLSTLDKLVYIPMDYVYDPRGHG